MYCTIRQFIISHGAGIDSIQIEYEARGCSVWSEKHGGNGGLKTDKVKLDYPDEYLVSLSGYFGSIECGPVIVSYYVDSIGMYMKPLTQQNQHDKRDNMFISNGDFERRDKVSATNETVKVSSNTTETAKGKEGYMFARGNGGFGEVETNDKVYITAEAAKGSSHMVHGVREKENYNLAPHYVSTEVETKYSFVPNQAVTQDQVYTTADAGRVSPYMRETEDYHKFASNGFSSDFDTKDRVNRVVQNAKGSTNIRQATMTCGPWGGNGGMLFDDGVYTGVREIHLSRTGAAVSIRVCYDMNGQAVWGNKNGGTGGLRVEKITLDYPSEFLTQISGYYGSMILRGPTIIKSLTFYTNKKKYGPFGDEQGIPFSSGSKDGIIVGFHGRKGWFIDGIGVHVIEGGHSIARPSCEVVSGMVKGQVQFGPAILPAGMVKEPAPCVPGPWGGDGGNTWDDGVFTGIKKIFLTKGEAIYSIQFEYDRNGQSMWSVKHGGSNEGSCHVVQFEYPNEVLTCISGYYGIVGRDECKKVVKSVSFQTNRGRYGPYGNETGTYFSSTKTEGKIVGFHGRSGCYLYAIGVHIQHWMNDRVQHRPIKAVFNKIFT
ncbi:Jacalin-related lectin like [Quillaja saponaria]|uniref:Mannose/glucose-specific lectin n=1 Tax=Quillaja saponaria TaxID=32244 RepID=A0AAD7PTE2_QUISA|nr:Jacalin-related lectin like [Quillaja saponaria]